MEEQKITEKPQMPSVKAVITLPLDYRARLNMMRVQFGYKHAGQLCHAVDRRGGEENGYDAMSVKDGLPYIPAVYGRLASPRL